MKNAVCGPQASTTRMKHFEVPKLKNPLTELAISAPTLLISCENSSPTIVQVTGPKPVKDKSLFRYMFQKIRLLSQANLATVAVGAALSWSSPATPKMGTSPSDSSWLGSLMPVGSAISPWIAGPMSDKFGRRFTLLLSVVPFLVGWGMLLGAENIMGLLFAARIMQGVAGGVVFTVVPMYVGEIASPDIRGALGTILQLSVTVGMLVDYTVGPYVSYIVFGVVCTALPVLFFASFFSMPESPYQKLSVGDDAEAKRALMRVRDHGYAVDEEVKHLKEEVLKAAENSAGFRELFSNRGNLKALYLSCGLVGFQQLCGINAVLFYAQTIFMLSHSSLDSSVSAIIIGVVMCLSSAVAPFVVDRLGRRPLLIFSAFSMAVTEVILGVYFYLSEATSYDISNLWWLPVTSLVLFIIVYCVGFGSLPWAVVGELFATEVKKVSAPCTACFCWVLGFIVTKFFVDIVEAWHTYTAFFIFAGFSVISGIFVTVLLPETKGKTFDEIQKMLNE